MNHTGNLPQRVMSKHRKDIVTRCYKSFRATPISFNELAPKKKGERTPALHQRAKTKSEQQNTLPRHTASYRYHHTNAHSKSEQPNSRMLSMCKSKHKQSWKWTWLEKNNSFHMFSLQKNTHVDSLAIVRNLPARLSGDYEMTRQKKTLPSLYIVQWISSIAFIHGRLCSPYSETNNIIWTVSWPYLSQNKYSINMFNVSIYKRRISVVGGVLLCPMLSTSIAKCLECTWCSEWGKVKWMVHIRTTNGMK